MTIKVYLGECVWCRKPVYARLNDCRWVRSVACDKKHRQYAKQLRSLIRMRRKARA